MNILLRKDIFLCILAQLLRDCWNNLIHEHLVCLSDLLVVLVGVILAPDTESISREQLGCMQSEKLWAELEVEVTIWLVFRSDWHGWQEARKFGDARQKDREREKERHE